jgi:hypothetical protein
MAYVKHGLRLVITAAMLAWIATRVDLGSVGAVLAQANPYWLVAGVAINLLAIVCAAWRWQTLLGGLGLRIRLPRLLRVVLSGAFFNMFLPSSVGGDVVKMVLIAPDMEQREDAVSSVLMDRSDKRRQRPSPLHQPPRRWSRLLHASRNWKRSWVSYSPSGSNCAPRSRSCRSN